jgi:hypothetical protein
MPAAVPDQTTTSSICQAMHAWRHSLRKRHNKDHASTWLPGLGSATLLDDAEAEEVDDCEIESLAQGDETRPHDARRRGCHMVTLPYNPYQIHIMLE